MESQSIQTRTYSQSISNRVCSFSAHRSLLVCVDRNKALRIGTVLKSKQSSGLNEKMFIGVFRLTYAVAADSSLTWFRCTEDVKMPLYPSSSKKAADVDWDAVPFFSALTRCHLLGTDLRHEQVNRQQAKEEEDEPAGQCRSSFAPSPSSWHHLSLARTDGDAGLQKLFQKIYGGADEVLHFLLF